MPRWISPRFISRQLALPILVAVAFWGLVGGGTVVAQEEEYEPIDSTACADCHEATRYGSAFADDISHSAHDGLECLDCHVDRDTVPHRSLEETFFPGCQGCRTCHEEASEEYQAHGRARLGSCEDMPQCSDCHGSHDILPSTAARSSVHPTNLPQTCGTCHENLDITTKYDILIDHPIQIYARSVHGQATRGGVYVAASCNDCHSSGGTAHKILSPGSPDSSINHFNIPKTCGQCHKGIESDYWEGIHGQLVARGETDAPVCTDCHGEHGILSPDDPLSPVSGSKVAEMTCSPCHESAVLNEKYGIKTERLTTFIDSYHGLKSKAGDTHVANCASCHGVHRILPSSDPTSTVNPANLQHTCGECHPNISEKMASTPIHGLGGQGLRTPAADVVEKIYIVAITVIIGLMILHWVIDLMRHLADRIKERPAVLRMHIDEVVQHALLTITFITLVISGFALRYDQGFMARFFFGWEGGFEIRGVVHRAAAIGFMITIIWHVLYLFSPRGRTFIKDMWPIKRDFQFFARRMLYNLGLRPRMECVQRFNYVEKAEYWALVWGTVVMVITGVMLWFDNWFIQFLPKGVLDVALVIHFWEAWLASLAILIWHFYSVIFHPHVYPMNPSWITGHVPEDMYEHEHPGHLEEARRETERVIDRRIERMRKRDSQTDQEEQPKTEAKPKEDTEDDES
ncbi:MAG: cytochrome b/b6 domain-containing protein [Acidobacteria bacterium]|nr:cytochrome b/b6 domain-containing protein [Acidobacteriota bacterium]